MGRKLFEVRMEVVAFVEAEDENSALEIGHNALREEADNCWDAIESREVTHREWVLEGGWNDRALVYGCKSDKTLGSWLEALPKQARLK